MTSCLSIPFSGVDQVWVAGAVTPRDPPETVAVPAIEQPAVNVALSQAAVGAELAAIMPPPAPITSADAASTRILRRLVRPSR